MRNILAPFLRQTVYFAFHSAPSRRPIYWIITSFWFSFAVPSLAGPHPSFIAQSILRRSSHTAVAMAKRDSPSAQRNKEPIWGVLSTKVLPLLLQKEVNLNVLEIAAGAGVHTEYFARKLVGETPSFQWFPTDPDEASRASIGAYISDACLASLVRDPLQLTLDKNGILEPSTASALPDLDLIICINMIHISPWEATIGLMKTASQKLRKGGILLCYGPYKEGGRAVESNRIFDRSLRSSDSSWGIRDLEDVVRLADDCGLTLLEKIEMPANNLSVLYRK